MEKPLENYSGNICVLLWSRLCIALHTSVYEPHLTAFPFFLLIRGRKISSQKCSPFSVLIASSTFPLILICLQHNTESCYTAFLKQNMQYNYKSFWFTQRKTPTHFFLQQTHSELLKIMVLFQVCLRLRKSWSKKQKITLSPLLWWC